MIALAVSEVELARLFLAVNIPVPVQKKIEETFYPKLPRSGLKLVKPENLHITLRFLGWMPKNSIPELIEKLQSLTQLAGFDLALNGLGSFKSRILWLGIKKGNSRLQNLAEHITRALTLQPEPFTGHITLARNKSLRGKEFHMNTDELGKIKLNQRFTVASVELMQSQLSHTGPAYAVIHSFALKKAVG